MRFVSPFEFCAGASLDGDKKECVRAIPVARSTIGGLRIARLVERATQKPHAEYDDYAPYDGTLVSSMDVVYISNKASTAASVLTNLRKLRSFQLSRKSVE